jgi:outer membrane protein OmpA-like peptidoglycan-associated protein
MMTGAGLDLAEGDELENRRQLDALKVRVAATERNFQNLQDELDSRGRSAGAMSVDGEVVFEEGSHTLSAGAGEKLGRIANRLKADPYLRAVQVHGHADDGGGAGKNDLLSQSRAETVAAVLSQNGVPRDRIQVLPHGDSLSLISKSGGAGRSANRRVEVVAVR